MTFNKKILVIIAGVILLNTAFAQQKDTDSLGLVKNPPKVENSLLGIQVGTLGLWVYHELAISERFALRCEVGVDMTYRVSFNGGVSMNLGFIQQALTPNFAFIPNISVEPRWYYFLNEERFYSKNSGSFLSLRLGIGVPYGVQKFEAGPTHVFLTPFEESALAYSTLVLRIIPKWGVRKTWWNHFTIEAGIGVGFRTMFLFSNGVSVTEFDGDMHLRIGYTF